MNVNRFQRGQIWWHENNTMYDGSVQGKTRPVIIISNNKANEHSSNVTIVPCTTQVKRMDIKTHIKFNGIDNIDNVALCENIMTISKDKLRDYIGTCDSDLLNRLDYGVCLALGLVLDEIEAPLPEPLSYQEMSQHTCLLPNILDMQAYRNESNDMIIDNRKTEPVVKRGRKPNMSVEDKQRFLNDCENHTADYMIKKYNLADNGDLAKKKYSYRKQLESKGVI